jgi:hypothetical protein
VRLEEDAATKSSGLGRRMTVKTVGITPQAACEDEETVSPMHLDLSNSQITVPEQAHMGLNTPARLREGIAAVDYFTVSDNHQAHQELSQATSEDILRVLGIFRENHVGAFRRINDSHV